MQDIWKISEENKLSIAFIQSLLSGHSAVQFTFLSPVMTQYDLIHLQFYE
jgi:hypothetical protein